MTNKKKILIMGDYPEPGDRLWMLKEQEKRPKGCVRKATVINE